MIQSLHISNYALIADIDISFAEGLNIITGETGAGKSIIIGALSLLLGDRADSKAIGDSSRKSVIEAQFRLENPESFASFFTENDLDSFGDRCILRREIAPGGRSRAFINDTPVTLNVLRDLAIRLVDIHSQHQNLLLSDPAYQLNIIDCLAGNEKLLPEYTRAYSRYHSILKKYSATRDMIVRGKDESDFLSYQLDELDALGLERGEQESLELERDTLANVNDIKILLDRALAAFDGDNDCIDRLETTSDCLRDLSGNYSDASSLASRLDTVIVELRDISRSVEDYYASTQSDPMRLEDIEARLSKLYSLETKHHVDSADALIDLRDSLRTRLATIADGENILAELETEARKAKKTAMLLAREISERRARSAAEFAEELRRTAEPLGMKNLRCEIAVNSGKLTPTGIDSVEFLFAFNKNQTLMPVGKTASGGEISRLMLSVKAIIGRKMQLPSIIFDEVDTGVSGDVASRMADMMQSLASRIQVIVITHLPQVAARGTTHFKVYKEDDDHHTTTRIRPLCSDERVSEIALMLCGSPDDPAARTAALSMLDKQK